MTIANMNEYEKRVNQIVDSPAYGFMKLIDD